MVSARFPLHGIFTNMARRGNSVVGIDLGKHSFKGVLLQRKSDSRFVLTGFATMEVPEEIATAEELSQQVKMLLREIGGSAKNCALAASDPDALLRIIEQPNTDQCALASCDRPTASLFCDNTN